MATVDHLDRVARSVFDDDDIAARA